jgi:hypothetical protein
MLRAQQCAKHLASVSLKPCSAPEGWLRVSIIPIVEMRDLDFRRLAELSASKVYLPNH